MIKVELSGIAGNTLNVMMRQCEYRPPTAARARADAREASYRKIYTGTNISRVDGALEEVFICVSAAGYCEDELTSCASFAHFSENFPVDESQYACSRMMRTMAARSVPSAPRTCSGSSPLNPVNTDLLPPPLLVPMDAGGSLNSSFT